uniref:P3C2B kinase n=4 Tax=Nothoprocta TaxID=8806 RepID=A0A8C6YWC6_NOTPE
MSAARGDGEPWPSLESVGISRKELALAEALQMEYDALARLRQHRDESRAKRPAEPPRISWDQPGAKEPRAPPGSEPAPADGTAARPGALLAADYLYILQGSEPRGGPAAPRDVPEAPAKPPLPPRHPAPGKDINTFSAARAGKLLGRRISQEEPYGSGGYEGLADAISCLNLKGAYEAEVLREAARGWKEGRSLREKEGAGKAVARSKTLPPQVPPRGAHRRNAAPGSNRRVSVEPVAPRPLSLANGYELFEVSEERDEEVAAFCHMLDVLRAGYSTQDYSLTGYVWSPVNLSPEHLGHGVSLKVTVVCDSLREPLTFTCDCSSTVDLLIYQTLCYTHDELHAVDVEDFVLKLCGLEEFLQNHHPLGSHEYIQHCRKFDIDIRLQLLRRTAARGDLARTANDDRSPSTLNHYIHLQERPIKQTISRQALSLLFDTFHNEVDAFLAAEGDFPLKAERVIQSVMALCNALAAVETPEITAALNQMPPCPSRMQPKSQKDPSVLAKRENRERIVESLTAAILELVELYCSTFNADFQRAVPGGRRQSPQRDARLLACPLAFTVYGTHRIPITWAASYEDFYLSCSLSHGGKELCSALHTRKAPVHKYLFHLIIWDQQ